MLHYTIPSRAPAARAGFILDTAIPISCIHICICICMYVYIYIC